MSTKRLQMDIDENLHLVIKANAILKNTNVRDYVVNLVHEDLKKNAPIIFKEENGKWTIK